MKIHIPLWRELFSKHPKILFEDKEFKVTAFCYSSGIEGLRIKNSRGYLVVLPWMGQMIWEAYFDSHRLTMKNMFSQPKRSAGILGTYGCFAFHSGLLANGCPSPEDTHPLHGEIPCADMDESWLEIENGSLRLVSSYEYVMGFGQHYRAQPSVTMRERSALFDVQMVVTNLASTAMMFQYMCHINYNYVPNAKFIQNIPHEAFELRQSIPAHVKPTENWLKFNEKIVQNKAKLTSLDEPDHYDPEIVFFADKLDTYTDKPEFQMVSPEGTRFVTRFSSSELNYVTRWILYNADQQVAAFALPATCRPEGFLSAKRENALIKLDSQRSRSFTITTGII